MKFVFTVTATIPRVGEDYVETIREELQSWLEDAHQETVYYEDDSGAERERAVKWAVEAAGE